MLINNHTTFWQFQYGWQNPVWMGVCDPLHYFKFWNHFEFLSIAETFPLLKLPNDTDSNRQKCCIQNVSLYATTATAMKTSP